MQKAFYFFAFCVSNITKKLSKIIFFINIMQINYQKLQIFKRILS